MRSSGRFFSVGLLLSFFAFACAPKQLLVLECDYPDVYTQDFTTQVVLIINEVNCQPAILGSGILIDREKGVFLTADHVTDISSELALVRLRLFFNGRVYNAVVIGSTPLHDVTVLRITDSFNPEDFPKPLRFLGRQPRLSMNLVVMGVHPHMQATTDLNGESGVIDRKISIFDEYYGIQSHDYTKKGEIVFDSIPARITAVNQRIEIRGLSSKDNGDAFDRARYQSNRYTRVQTERNHHASFAGLSGGLIVAYTSSSRSGTPYIYGVITAEDMPRLEFDENGDIRNLAQALEGARPVYDAIYFTPTRVQEVKDLVARAARMY